MAKRIGLVVIGLLLALAACGSGSDGATISARADRQTDQVTTTVADGRALIDVISPSGSSSLTATLEDGAWPTPTTVRLHLSGLDLLEIRYGDVVITTSESTGLDAPKPRLTIIGDDGNAKASAIPAKRWYPVITVSDAEGGADSAGRQNKVYDISMPMHFHQADYPSLTMHWEESLP